MSLLSVDITKVKRLSLRDAKLPAPELRVKATPFIQVDKYPTDEEIIYNRLALINPAIEKLVERLNLVSINTGKRINKIELSDNIKPHPEPAPKPLQINIIDLAERVINRENNYSKDEIIARIKDITNVSQERAERDFNLILQAKAVETILGERYYLKDSTPF